MQIYDVKIKVLDEKIGKLDKILSANAAGEDKCVNCKECDNSFTNKKDLNEHIQQINPKKYNCKHCDQTFSESWRLEIHLRTHKDITPLSCEICEKQFYVAWRLKKHLISHKESSKFCHYFNNAKICPYEEIGCRFKHEVSDNCKFEKNAISNSANTNIT